jgi:transcriptional regulator with XRE-family HTH domain
MVTLVTGYSMAIADRLTSLRERRGWSMGQLADRSGVSRAAISRIESGGTPSPGAATLVRLAGALGVDLADLTGDRPMPRRQPQVLEGAVGLPVYKRRVHAGGDSFWGDTEDTLWVPHEFLRMHPRARVAIVDGTCMSPFVEQGEKIVFDPDQRPVDRQMVVVTTDQGETLLKWYRLDALGRPYLRSADGDEIRPNGARIEGVVIEMRRGAVRDPEA